MLKIIKKVEFLQKDNKMQSVADTATAKKIFSSSKSLLLIIISLI